MKTGKIPKQAPLFRPTGKPLLTTSFSVGGDHLHDRGHEEMLLGQSLTSLGAKFAMENATVIKCFIYKDRKGRVYETPDPLDEDYMAHSGFVLDSYSYFIML